MYNITDELKTALTQIVQTIVRANEVKKGFVDEQYVASKKWSSPLDFENNKKFFEITELLGLNTVEVSLLYQAEGLESPMKLEMRNPNSKRICNYCHDPIHEGEEILYDGNMEWVHKTCDLAE